MSNNLVDALTTAVEKAPLETDPYPHFYTDSIFPQDVYTEILQNLPDTYHYQCFGESGLVPKGAYKERYFINFTQEELSRLPLPLFFYWSKFANDITSSVFCHVLFHKFKLEKKFKIGELKVMAGLVRDLENYSLGPHTDDKKRLITLLFYLPEKIGCEHLGTAIYRAKNPAFQCDGTTHHSFEGFDKIKTMPYRPNSAFAFLRSNHSFHGVEPIKEGKFRRDSLCLTILRDLDLSGRESNTQR